MKPESRPTGLIIRVGHTDGGTWQRNQLLVCALGRQYWSIPIESANVRSATSRLKLAEIKVGNLNLITYILKAGLTCPIRVWLPETSFSSR